MCTFDILVGSFVPTNSKYHDDETPKKYWGLPLSSPPPKLLKNLNRFVFGGLFKPSIKVAAQPFKPEIRLRAKYVQSI